MVSVRNRDLTAVDLREMSKRAARHHVNGAMSLNDAVVKMAQETDGMTQQQILRLVEGANRETFSSIFRANREDGDAAKRASVDFTLADPEEVLRLLGEPVEPVETVKYPSEYGAAPVSFRPSVSVFGPQEKTASVRPDDWNPNEPHRRLYNTHLQLQRVLDDLQADRVKLAFRMKDALQEIEHHLGQLLADGVGLHEATSAMEKVADVSWVKAVLSGVVPGLMKSGRLERITATAQVLGDSIKTASAHRIPDTRHPMLKAFSAYVQLGAGHTKLAKAEELLQQRLDHLAPMLQRARAVELHP